MEPPIQLTKRIKHAIQLARDEHPIAYMQTMQAGKRLTPKHLHILRVDGGLNYKITQEYAKHGEDTRLAVERGDQVLTMSTKAYWKLHKSLNVHESFSLGQELRMSKVWAHSDDRESTRCRIICQHGRVAPLSETFHFKDSMPSLKSMCMTCNCTFPFRECVVCNCFAQCFCSEECKQKNAPAHASACVEEKQHAERLVRTAMKTGLGNYPFHIVLVNDQVEALPIEVAIELPLLPSTLLEGLSLSVGKVAVLNAVLVHSVIRDFERQAAIAESMAGLLIEEEDTKKQKAKPARHKKKKNGREPPTLQPQRVAVVQCEAASAAESVVEVKTECGSPRTSTPPNVLLCPITHELMTDPVITACGFTFEREAIENWFCRSNTNPMTGSEVEHTRLIANINLRIMCQMYTGDHV